MHSECMEDISRMDITIGIARTSALESKRTGVCDEPALCGHVYVEFHEDTCVNAGLFGCGVGSNLCMRPCSTSLKIMHL